jgi:hypothetical protein
VLEQMRALARLIKERGDLLGKLSRDLKKIMRKRGMRDLLAYVGMCTGEHFNAEIAYLLGAAYRANGLDKVFTADLVKKFRQRHVAKPRNPERDKVQPLAVVAAVGAMRSVGRESKSKTFGQRIARIV